MRVSLGHVQAGVADQFADGVQGDAANRQPATERMAQRVKDNFLPTIRQPLVEAERLDHPGEGVAGVRDAQRLSSFGAKEQIIQSGRYCFGKHWRHRVRHVGHARSCFCVADVHDLGREINIAPAQGQNLADAHAGMQADDRQTPPSQAPCLQRVQESLRFVRRQIANTRVVRARHLEPVGGDAARIEVPGDELAIDAPDIPQDQTRAGGRQALAEQLLLEGLHVQGRDTIEGRQSETRTNVAHVAAFLVTRVGQIGQPLFLEDAPGLGHEHGGLFLARRKNAGVTIGANTLTSNVGRHLRAVPLAGPADLLPNKAPRGVAEVDVETNIRLAIVPPRVGNSPVDAREFGLFSAHFC